MYSGEKIENRSIFGDDMDKKLWLIFVITQCRFIWHSYLLFVAIETATQTIARTGACLLLFSFVFYRWYRTILYCYVAI